MLGSFPADVNGMRGDGTVWSCRQGLRSPLEEQATSRKLMDEFIIDDRSGKSHFSVFEFRCVLRSHYPPLADDIRVLLAGNLFRHLEHHLDQGVDGKALRPCEQDPALADVLNNTLVPRAGFVHAIAQRDIELQAAGARHPRRTLLPRMAPPDAGLGLGML